MKIAVFWVAAPCSLVEVYQRFGGPCCLHHQGDHRRRRENLKSYFVIRMIESKEVEKGGAGGGMYEGDEKCIQNSSQET
jgi:hypothetical protein